MIKTKLYFDYNASNYVQVIDYSTTCLQPNSLDCVYNSTNLCKSPKFIDSNLHCSSCFDNITGCDSCYIKENLTTICLSYYNISTTDTDTIIEIVVPIGSVSFLLILLGIYCYKKKKRENSLKEGFLPDFTQNQENYQGTPDENSTMTTKNVKVNESPFIKSNDEERQRKAAERRV